MAIQLQGNNGTLVEVGGATFKGAHVHLKPLEHGGLGHYRTFVRLTMVADQGANSRLFELRNSGGNLIIPTRLTVSAVPIGGVASPYAFELGLYKFTSFSAVDTLNTVTPGVAVMRTSGMTGAPGGAVLRRLSDGVNSGMSGGTLTKDQQLAGLVAWMASVSASSQPVTRELIDPKSGEHPPVLANNEGLVLENVTVGSATANAIRVLLELAWAEVTAF